jgi:hypothetical protein
MALLRNMRMRREPHWQLHARRNLTSFGTTNLIANDVMRMRFGLY